MALAAGWLLVVILFKVNSTGGKKGEVWAKAFHFFHAHRDRFLSRYHQRSNVESVFSMVKRKFGDGLRSKSYPALYNEALAKVLAHNLVVLVHEMYELGITSEFGGKQQDTEEDGPWTVKFPGKFAPA